MSTKPGAIQLKAFQCVREKGAKGYSMLEKIRNQTFHYDRGKFQGALNTLKKLYGEDIKDGFIAEIIQEEPLLARTYYNFASTIRNTVVFGVKSREELENEMSQLTELHGQFYKFLDAALLAYVQTRSLKKHLSWDDEQQA